MKTASASRSIAVKTSIRYWFDLGDAAMVAIARVLSMYGTFVIAFSGINLGTAFSVYGCNQ